MWWSMRAGRHTTVAMSAMLLLICSLASYSNTPAETRSEAALRSLKSMGAQVLIRDETDGPGKIIITTDGSWRGGDEGLAQLKDVQGLYKLRLGGPITDAGLKHVASLRGLTSLDIHVVAVTDKGVRELQALHELTRLNLTYTKVTDAGLGALTGMKRLQWLGLAYTQVTAAGVARLKRSLENTIIEGNFS